MRQTIIGIFEKLVSIAFLIGTAIIVIGGVSSMFSHYGGDFWSGLVFILSGMIMLILSVGVVYVVLGIYENSKRTNELLEEIRNKQS